MNVSSETVLCVTCLLEGGAREKYWMNNKVVFYSIKHVVLSYFELV